MKSTKKSVLNTVKILLFVIAASLIMSGLILFTVVMSFNKWDFKEVSTVKYETVTHEIKNEFTSIDIEVKTADVIILPSKDEKTTLDVKQEAKMPFSVEVVDGRLTVKPTNNKKWYDYIGINFGSTRITLYLPEGDYTALNIKGSTSDICVPDNFTFDEIDVSVSTGAVECSASANTSARIKTSTGNITFLGKKAGKLDLTASTGNIVVKNMSCGDINLKVSTGKTILECISCASIQSKGTTGKISLERVNATVKMEIERDTGDVTLDRCDAGEIYITTSTGNVKGSLTTDKSFSVHTDTGRTVYPEFTSGGKCKITTDTGDVIIEITPIPTA